MSGVHVRVQMLNTDVPCAKYSELLEKVYDSDWVQKEEQRNKVSNIRSSHVETDLIVISLIVHYYHYAVFRKSRQ